MLLKFSKMHGLGNDFVVLDAIHQTVALDQPTVQRLADRRFGIGCDQLLLVEPPTQSGVDFRYRIFNADGGEVEQCGNGARCFARYVRDHGLTDKNEIVVETAGGIIVLTLTDDGLVTVNMGMPRLAPVEIPFDAPAQSISYALNIDGQTLELGAVSMGNPHAVLRVEDVERTAVEQIGPLVESHPRFPKRVNVGFMQVVDRGHIRLRVFERGAGETLACGTGACAAVVAGRLRGWLDSPVRVSLPGGDLIIAWAGEGEPVWMTGPAVEVFQGAIEL